MFIVTGGAGFIGSNVVQALEGKYKDEKIVVVDVFNADEKWKNLSKRSLWEIIPPETLFTYLKIHEAEIKAIFHLGAISSTMESDVDLILQTNFRLTIDLWTWCSLEKKPFYYASSAATYGNGSTGFSDESTLSHLSTLHPLNAYGWSKHLTDLRILKMVHEGFQPPHWAGFKFFNVYGPNEYHKEDQKSVIATFFPVAKEKGTLSLFKSNHPDYAHGEQKRDFVWVGDCCDVMIWFYDTKAPNGIYNVGSGKAETFNTLAHLIFENLHLSPQITYRDMPSQLSEKYQNFTQADLTLLRKSGYARKMTPLGLGVKTYIQQYLSAEDPYL